METSIVDVDATVDDVFTGEVWIPYLRGREISHTHGRVI